jgi:hypothetical protein
MLTASTTFVKYNLLYIEKYFRVAYYFMLLFMFVVLYEV